VTRRVDRKGQVSVYNRNHYVGKQFSGQDIYVVFDPADREWYFATAAGVQLRRKLAEEILARTHHFLASYPSSFPCHA